MFFFKFNFFRSAHKSSKKLLEQCQKLDKVWNHIFSATVTLNDNTENWYRKVRELIDKQQTGALWMSEAKVSFFSFGKITMKLVSLFIALVALVLVVVVLFVIIIGNGFFSFSFSLAQLCTRTMFLILILIDR